MNNHTIKVRVKQKCNALTNRISEWPGLYSLVFSVAIGFALVHYETALGAKISMWSNTQITLILFVICVVAKNVFI